MLVCLRCGLSGRSFLPLMICLSKVCQKKVCRCEVHVIPKDGQSLIVLDDLSDALNGHSFLHRGQMSFCLRKVYQMKVCLTSSFFPGGRRLVLRCVAYQSTRALERGRLILEHRRSFWCRALHGHLLCDVACDRLRF